MFGLRTLVQKTPTVYGIVLCESDLKHKTFREFVEALNVPYSGYTEAYIAYKLLNSHMYKGSGAYKIIYNRKGFGKLAMRMKLLYPLD